MKKIVKIFKWVGIILLILLAVIFATIFIASEKKPTGVASPEADQLAQEMLTAINKPAWDSTAYIQWTFKGMHEYLWDKERHFSKVSWGDYEVLLDINKIGGIARKDGALLSAEKSEEIIQKAWEYWCNDSFWLNAPSKIFDPGTTRSLVTLKDEREGLMVSYASGGVTPGDSYVWILDENKLPSSYKMWVKIIPVGGVEFTWDKWEELDTGAKIATWHEGLIDLDISDLEAGYSYRDMGLKEDPFVALY
ncbi:MAG: hypothetical protein HKN16_12235 [Saprospiraceae bacterium]|nr:hypothetical protein [Saprospiraceae bacterium]